MYDIIKRRNRAENGHLPYYYNKTPPDLQLLGGRKVSRFEKLTAALAAAFFLICTLYFLFQNTGGQPYRVTAAAAPAQPAAVSEETAEDESWPESLLPGERININTAPAIDLTRLPQIGEKRAQAIVDWREEHGPFQSPEDLMQVSGIGEGIFGQLKEYITVE